MSAVDVHAVVTGSGPAVVLSNSLGSDHRMWDAQLAELEKRFTVVRYDTRGHGVSPVPPGPYSIDDLTDDVVALLDRLDIERAHVVGLSLGGMTAMRLAARNPERVDRMVLLCTAVSLPPSQAWTDRADTVRAGGCIAVADGLVQRWFSPGYTGDRSFWTSMIAATPVEGYAGCCAVIAELDLREQLPSIAAPTLVVAGADDPATPPAMLAEIADAIPGARLLVVDDAAHLASAEQPAIITPAIIDHLEQS